MSTGKPRSSVSGSVSRVSLAIAEKGHSYEGDWLDPPGVAHGNGKYVWEDGSFYSGEWRMGLAHGFGIKEHPNGQVFEGMWKNDLQDGEGKCKYPDGTTFQGSFNKGMKDGQGSLNFPDGSTYVGSFQKDLMHGQAVFTRVGIGTFEGEFAENNMKFGKFTSADGVVYDGQWRRNKQHGFGIAFKEGKSDRYEGYWIYGRKVSVGEFLDDLVKEFPKSKRKRPLHFALSKRNSVTEEDVFHLIKLCPDEVQSKDKAGLLPLHTAAYNGASLNTIEKLIEHYPESISIKTLGGGVPLHSAIFGCAPFETIVKLLDYFPEAVKIITKNGNSCLALASYRGLTALIPLLMALDPSAIGRKNKKGETPQSLAHCLGHKRALGQHLNQDKTVSEFRKNLSKGGINGLTMVQFTSWAKKVMSPNIYTEWISEENWSNKTTLPSSNGEERNENESPVKSVWMNSLSDEKWGFDTIKNLFRDYPLAAREEDEWGSMLLHWAVYMNAPLETIQFIYRKNKSAIRVPGNSRHLPLHFTINRCDSNKQINFEVVRFLFDEFRDAAVILTSRGNTFLHLVCKADGAVPTEWFQMILKHFPETTSMKNDAGFLPLHLLSETCRVREQLELLIKAYPEGVYSVSSTEKWIPLHLAASVGNLISVKCLLKEFAPGVHELDTNGNTALKLAFQNKSLGVSRDRENVISLLAKQKSAAMDHARIILRKVLLSGDSQPWMRSKLMLVGEGRAGKTSTLRSLMGKSFRENEISTIGANTDECIVDNFNITINRDKNSQPWRDKADLDSEFDMAVAKLVRTGLQKKKAQTVVRQNLTNVNETDSSTILPDGSKSPKQLKEKKKEFEETQNFVSNDSSSIVPTLDDGGVTDTATPIDSSKHPEIQRNAVDGPIVHSPMQVKNRLKSPEQRAEEIINNYGDLEIQNLLEGVENTLKLGIWDYGGQEIFYAVHHLFLTRFGVYLVLFDMRKILSPESGKESLNFIKFWLNSIALYARETADKDKEIDEKGSPIFLIGSHKDIIDSMEDHKEISDVLTEHFADYIELQNVQLNEEEGLCFFPVDNTVKNDCTVRTIRRRVEQVISEEKYIREVYPIAWMTVCDKLKTRSHEEAYLSLEEVYELALECGIQYDGGEPDATRKSWLEVNAMLAHFHQLGVVVYYGHRPGLDQLVILHPQWIVDRISDVIREFSAQGFSHVRGRDKFAKEMDNEWSNLIRKGVLSKRLLRHLWRGDHRHIDFLLTLMQTFALICPFKIPNEGSLLLQYMVPSLLPSEDFPLEVNKKHDIEINFGNFIPSGIFGRLIVVLLEYYFTEKLADSSYHFKGVEEKGNTDGVISELLDPSAAANGSWIYKDWCAFKIRSKGSFIVSMRLRHRNIAVYLLDNKAKANAQDISSIIGKLVNTLNSEFYNSKLNISLLYPDKKEKPLIIDLSESWHRPRLDILTSRRIKAPAYLTDEAKANGYYTIPDLGTLSSDGDLSHIEDFVVGRKGYGKILWLCPVNLSEAGAIDDIVFIERGDVSVYEFHQQEPMQGYELNCPARVEFEHFFPKNRQDDRAKARFLRRMKKIESNGGYKNCEYDIETGSWKFDVQHFTVQGWHTEDDELVEWILRLLWLPRRHERNRDVAKDYAAGLLQQDYYLEEIVGDPPPPHDDWSPAEDPPSISVLENAGFRPLHIKKIVRHLANLYPNRKDYQYCVARFARGGDHTSAQKPVENGGEETDSPANAPEKKVTKATATFDVFLSHDWGKFTTKKKNGQPEIEVQNHERVKKINNELKSVGLTTWFDEDKMSGNINDQMVSGIDHSSCFIAFITKNYILKVSGEGPNGKSDNCKKEFEYAERRKTAKCMIPVLMDPSAWNTKEWSGSVGMCLGGDLYFQMDEADIWEDDKKFNVAICKLAEKIKCTILSNGGSLVKGELVLGGTQTSSSVSNSKSSMAPEQNKMKAETDTMTIKVPVSSKSKTSTSSMTQTIKDENQVLSRTINAQSTSTEGMSPTISSSSTKNGVPGTSELIKTSAEIPNNTMNDGKCATTPAGSGLRAARSMNKTIRDE